MGLLYSVHRAGRMRDGEEQSEEEPTLGRRGGGRQASQIQAGQRQGEERGFHLENLFLHLLQPPQHPREGQRSRAGGRQAGKVFRPAQLQVRLGSGSPGPGWTLATSRHLL